MLDSEGEPLRRGIEAEPYLVTPNVREAEQLVGHEFGGEDDMVAALDEIADLGARNVLITNGTAASPSPRGQAELRLDASLQWLEPISKVGSGDALLAGFLAARVAGKGVEEAVRAAVRPAPPPCSRRAPAASTYARPAASRRSSR